MSRLAKTIPWERLSCRHGCTAPVVELVYFPDGCLCIADPLQALCWHHTCRSEGAGRPGVLVASRAAELKCR